MRKLIVFNLITVDGFYAGLDGDISWHNVDDEFQEFAIEQTKTFATHVYGRVTYEIMANYWPAANARETDPIVANLMNTTPKVVFSKTLKAVKESEYWKNITLYHELTPEIILDLKKERGGDIAILGSGTIVQQLTNWCLIDEYRLLVNPLILGKGKAMFANIQNRVDFTLINTRIFKNGNVLLYYVPKH